MQERCESTLFVKGLPGLEAVVELAEESVQQVALSGSVPVSVLSTTPVVGVGSGRGGEGGKSLEEPGVHEAVVLDEAASDELGLA